MTLHRLAWIVGLTSAFGSPAWGVETTAKVVEVGLAFELSGAWSKQKRDDQELAVYRARDVAEVITLRVFKSKKRMDSKERRETVDALIEHRRAAEQRDMGGKATFQSVRSSERNGLTTGNYCGVDRTTGRPFATLVLASEENAWTLFYETLAVRDTTFCSRAERVFGTMRPSK
jgi:hypothetical protein